MSMTFWFLVFGLPLLFGGAAFLAVPSKAAEFLRAFPRNRFAGVFLCAIAWFWTGHEIDALGIDVIDRIVQRLWFLPSPIPGAVWIWAIVLTFLTCWWMENLLPVRAVCAFFMLFPGDMFPDIRLCETQWRLTLVVFAYAVCIVGMWGMFYPWRLRQGMTWLSAAVPRVRAAGAVMGAVGALFAVLGFFAASGSLR